MLGSKQAQPLTDVAAHGRARIDRDDDALGEDEPECCRAVQEFQRRVMFIVPVCERTREELVRLCTCLTSVCLRGELLSVLSDRGDPFPTRAARRDRRGTREQRASMMCETRTSTSTPCLALGHTRTRSPAGGASHLVVARQHELCHGHVFRGEQAELGVGDDLAPVELGLFGAHGAEGARE
jgi:hypothetical protein